MVSLLIFLGLCLQLVLLKAMRLDGSNGKVTMDYLTIQENSFYLFLYSPLLDDYPCMIDY